MTESIRLGVLGTGQMAQTMVAAVRHVPGVEVVAIASRDLARAQSVAASLGIARHHGSTEALLADAAIDAVYIANENRFHAEATIAALGAGKAVLCEKPFASTVAEGEAVREAARQSGRLFMEAVTTPFLPAVAQALGVAASGAIGTLRHFAADFGYPTTPQTHAAAWRADGGVLLDRAIYPITLARLALGPIRDAQVQIVRNAEGLDTDAALLLEHDEGKVSLLAASLTTLLANTMTLAGARGSVVVDAPLLAAETVRVTQAEPRPSGDGAGRAARLKQIGFLRRARGLLQGLKLPHVGYGPSPYVHVMAHFRDLYRSGDTGSTVLPIELSLEVLTVIERAARGDG
jgi:predicted dehydrogenase